MEGNVIMLDELIDALEANGEISIVDGTKELFIQTVDDKGEAPYEYTFVGNYRIAEEGQAPNYLIYEVIHVTINATDETTVDKNIITAK